MFDTSKIEVRIDTECVYGNFQSMKTMPDAKELLYPTKFSLYLKIEDLAPHQVEDILAFLGLQQMDPVIEKGSAPSV